MPLQITTERHRTLPTPYPTPLNIADALHTPPYHAYALRSQTAQHPTRLIYAGTSPGGAMPLLCFPLRNRNPDISTHNHCQSKQCDAVAYSLLCETMTQQGILYRTLPQPYPTLLFFCFHHSPLPSLCFAWLCCSIAV